MDRSIKASSVKANCIKAKVEFYFKGELFAPETIINLDEVMHNSAELPDLYLWLAEKNAIDSYSYHYEVMLQEPINFSEATGLAKLYCRESHFDIQAFENAWRQQQLQELIQSIAMKYMQVADLDSQVELKQALLAAYEEGQKANPSHFV